VRSTVPGLVRSAIQTRREPVDATRRFSDDTFARTHLCARWSGRVRFRETSAGSPISRNKSPRVTQRLWRHGCGATNDGPRVAGIGVRYGVFLPKRWFNRRAGCAFTVSARCQCANPPSRDPLRSFLRKYLNKEARELGKLSQPRTVKSRSSREGLFGLFFDKIFGNPRGARVAFGGGRSVIWGIQSWAPGNLLRFSWVLKFPPRIERR
jgi:hypothetical protein